jgi:V8-like Glu-specific endopeptidase
MGVSRLKGPQLLRLRNLLRAAFTSQAEFDELLLVLDKRLSDFASGQATYPAAVLQTLEVANGRLWWRDLLREACNSVKDPALLAFANEVGLAADIVAADGQRELRGNALETKIRDSGSTFDVLTWRTKLAEIEGRVCRIEFPELQARGTGFLVAPDLVLTNYHVIQDVHKGVAIPGAVVARFDYKVLRDGVTVGAGTTYPLHNDWLVDHSQYSGSDFETQPAADAPPDKLDYALLRLAQRAGDQMLEGVPRKWIALPSVQHDFIQSPALYIVQHPEGKPMQVALDTQSVIKATPTRVRYTTSTEPGSSGSPCFSADWDWVALHHSGDPKYYQEGKKPEYNQGIPTSAIANLLRDRSKLAALGG